MTSQPNCRKRTRRFRAGSAVLEMALLFLPLLWLTFGAIDFGYYFYMQHNLQGAAREGARAAIPYYATDADVSAAVKKIMDNAGFTNTTKYPYTVEVSPSANGASAGTEIKVTVKLPYTPLGVPPARVNVNEVKSSVTMRKEDS